jgi:hypothetical protein
VGSNNFATTLDNGVLIGDAAKEIIASWDRGKDCYDQPISRFRVLVDDGKQEYAISGHRGSNFPPHPAIENSWYVGSPEQLKAAIESADEVRGLDFGNGLRGLRLMHPENEGFEFSFVVPDLDNQFRAYAAEVDEVGGVQYDAMLMDNEFFAVMEDDGKELKHVLLGNIEASPRVENKEWLANMGTAYINAVRFGWDAPANKPDYPMWSKVKPIYGLHIKDLDGNAVWVVPQQ